MILFIGFFMLAGATLGAIMQWVTPEEPLLLRVSGTIAVLFFWYLIADIIRCARKGKRSIWVGPPR